MAFDYQAIITRALKEPFFDTSIDPDYAGLLRPRVAQAVVPVGRLYWRAICAYHMPDSGGNPNVYMAAVDQQGKVVRNNYFGWTWEGRRPQERANPVRADKPPSEPPANINLGKYQIVTVWVEGEHPSDLIANLRSDWPDRLYHAATFVAWQLTLKGGETPPPEPPPQPTNEYERGLKDGRTEIIDKLKKFTEGLI